MQGVTRAIFSEIDALPTCKLSVFKPRKVGRLDSVFHPPPSRHPLTLSSYKGRWGDPSDVLERRTVSYYPFGLYALSTNYANGLEIGKDEIEEVSPHLRGGSYYKTEITTSISSSSAVELNTTSALAYYATEAGNEEVGVEFLHNHLSPWRNLTPTIYTQSVVGEVITEKQTIDPSYLIALTPIGTFVEMLNFYFTMIRDQTDQSAKLSHYIDPNTANG
uniref:(California timema) hypothetical protein n=1 Tax=Timema californicum TaxID=61474 RepID=A0A7R9P3M5_TIMCA|nr:unnamed protein product [Timema californicum]